MSKANPTEYELATHKGRQSDEARSSDYCGSCSIEMHCRQLKDPESWVHSSLKQWEKLGGWESPEEKESYNQKLAKEIDEHWRKTELLSNLIHSSIQKTAEDVCNIPGNSLEYLDSSKLGCYIAWTERLVSLLEDKEIDRLISNLEKT